MVVCCEMKTLLKDLQTNRIKVLVETIDDLWHLYNLIKPGDRCFALTTRRDTSKDDKIRDKRGEKRRVYLGIDAEDIIWHEFSDMLRIKGRICTEKEGISQGDYHTLNITTGMDLLVEREQWTREALDMISQAEKESKKPLVSFVSLDDEAAIVAVLRQYGIQKLAEIRSYESGKMYESKSTKKDYFEEILDTLKLVKDAKSVVIVGPGFVKEDILSFIKENGGEFASSHQITTFGSADAGMLGIQEALKSGAAIKALEDARLSYETQLMERLLSEIAKDGLCAYGKNQISEALESGAVETLLILDELVREEEGREFLSLATEMRARTVIVSQHHDAGNRLRALGGIAALLRYRT